VTQPIDQPQEQNDLYYNGTPVFKPRHITSNVSTGTSGPPPAAPAPVSPTIAKMVPVKDVEANFVKIEPLFKEVADLLDKRGAGLNLCNNASENITLAILRQKHDNETCWEFYKRMYGITREVPPLDPDKQRTFGEQLASKNQIALNDPINSASPISVLGAPPNYSAYGGGGEQRINNFDEDPGPANFILMAFMAIIRLIISAVVNMIGQMVNSGSNATSSIGEIATTAVKGGSDPAAVLAAALVPAPPPPPNTSAPWPKEFQKGIANIIKGLFNMLVPGGGFIAGFVADFVSQLVSPLIEDGIDEIIGKGPKLNRDVTRYDALSITSHVQELSRTSMAPHWPEAVMLFAQFSALQSQYNNSKSMFGYFNQNGLTTAPVTSAPLMPSDLADVLGIQIGYSRDSLGQMRDVLAGTLIESGYCCMLKFLGGMDPKFLRTLQAILQAEMNGLAIQFDSSDAMLNNIWMEIQSIILGTLMSLLFNLVGEIEQQVKPFFLGLNPGGCIQWNFLTESMLQYIRKLEDKLLSLVLEFNNKLRMQHDYTTEYAAGLGQSQYLRLLNSLLQVLIDSRISGLICGSSNIPTDTELAQVFTQFSNLVNYQPLSPVAVTVGTSPGQGTGTTPSGSTGNSTNNGFDDCLKKVSPEEVAQVQAWINQLKGMA
jgi:hypothetical protein